MQSIAVVCFDHQMFKDFCRSKGLNPTKAFADNKYYFHATERTIYGRSIHAMIKYGDWINDENLKLMPHIMARMASNGLP